MVALFVGGLMLTVIYQMFITFGRQSQHPFVANAAEESMLTVAQTLQRDLIETNLQTVRSFPNSANPNEPPGLILESPRDSNDVLQLGPFTPGDVRPGSQVLWQKWVYYSLRPNVKKPGFSELTRDEQVLPKQAAQQAQLGVNKYVTVMPFAPTDTPTTANVDPKRHRVLTTSMLSPNPPADVQGGFYIYWNDAAGDHPFEAPATGRGEPVIAVLTINTGANPNHPDQRDGVSSTGKPTVLKLMLEVKPRN
jgi:hypothetical protein